MKTNPLKQYLGLALMSTALQLQMQGAPTKTSEGVPSANARDGSPENVIAEGFELRVIAQGTDPLENPSGIITHFAYLSDGIQTPPLPPIKNPGAASKTEPDENTYLELDHNPSGPTPGYEYGRHFLFQGHENGNDLAYITRINLDVGDPAHRITLLTPVGSDNKTHLNRIDGSVFNPHSQTLLFTQENGNAGGVIEAGLDWNSGLRNLYGILGQGGYEGIHPDDRGNLIIVEDVGGTGVPLDPTRPFDAVTNPKVARNPNSFVYRFLPKDPSDLGAGGKLQALQVWIEGQAVKFVPVAAVTPNGDVFSEKQLKLHTLGSTWPCTWVTIHDTEVEGRTPFDANAAAKNAGATPFKRPENVAFLPGSGFSSFFFDPTGDTDARSGNQPALAARGAWGSIFRADFPGNSDSGRVSIVVLGDAEHAAFDNVTFADTGLLLATEDRGDSLHRQLNKLDSIWAFDIRRPGSPGFRLLALGRDPESAIDSAYLETALGGFQNDGDNEPTGLTVSDGGTAIENMQGKPLNPNRARVFFTQQHGMNRVFEVVK